ncbi:FtsX-like permease family protein [Streptomyces sp. NPDC101181]|uniref:FtsX-like permease family protein n=1 Tax=Streptomyces sp. NPDC101181 TaxID=3366125 RepID=UPI0038128CD7
MTPRSRVVLARVFLAGVLRHPARLMMTGLSVLVAAFVVMGAVLAQEVTRRTTLEQFSDTPSATSLVAVVRQGPGITEAVTDAVRRLPGVAEATARTSAQAPLDGISDRLVELRADPGQGELARTRVVSGSYPRAAGEVAVNEDASRHWNVRAGDRLRLLFPSEDPSAEDRPVAVTVTGVVTTRSDRMETAYASASVVNGLSHRTGSPRLDVRAAPGTSAQVLSGRIAETLERRGVDARVTAGAEVRDAEARSAVGQYADFFRIVSMFLAVAVVAAALVATSTFRVVFAQRLAELAMLRVIGARRRQLVRALAVEGAVTGLLCGSTGVVLALGAGRAVPAVAGAAGQHLAAPGLPLGAAAAVVVGAAVVTVCAVLAPAFAAAKVSPLAALRTASTAAAEGLGPGRRAGGAALAVVGAAAGVLVLTRLPEPGDVTYESSENLALTALSGMLVFGALLALGPLLVRPALAVAGRALRRLGPVGKLAVTGVGGTPHRAAALSLVVALGVSLVSATLVGIASMRSHEATRLAVQAPADFSLHGPETGLAPDLVTRLRGLPQLTDVHGYRQTEVRVEGAGAGGVSALDLDPTALPSATRLDTASGELDDLGPGRVVLEAGLAAELGVRAGDDIRLEAARSRSLRLSVAATLTGAGPLTSDLLLAPADLDRTGAPRPATAILANAAGRGQDGRSAAVAAITEAAEGRSGIRLGVLADDRDRSAEDIAWLATTALGLLGLTLLIAVIGVSTTTALTVRERTRESALLRALGLGRPGLRTMIGIEAGLYGVLGGIVGLAIGVPYAWLTARALNLGAVFELPLAPLAAVLGSLVALTTISGLLSTRRATQVSPVAALGDTA